MFLSGSLSLHSLVLLAPRFRPDLVEQRLHAGMSFYSGNRPSESVGWPSYPALHGGHADRPVVIGEERVVDAQADAVASRMSAGQPDGGARRGRSRPS